jgi:hypothetical protein
MADPPLARYMTATSSTPKHPLSPGLHPTPPRRPSSQAGYFDAPSPVPPLPETSQRHHSSSISSTHRNHRTSDADLLGIGPSPRVLRRNIPGTMKPSPAISDQGVMEDPPLVPEPRPVPSRGSSGRSKPYSIYVNSLSREEMQIVDTRFDLMSEPELSIYLSSFSQSSRTPRQVISLSPTTPRPTSVNSVSGRVREVSDDGDTSPLFPPSPPNQETRREMMDHPLRILARAVRELKEAIESLEEENEILRNAQGRRTIRRGSGRQVDQVPHTTKYGVKGLTCPGINT